MTTTTMAVVGGWVRRRSSSRPSVRPSEWGPSSLSAVRSCSTMNDEIFFSRVENTCAMTDGCQFVFF